jgi:hypothetical protein
MADCKFDRMIQEHIPATVENKLRDITSCFQFLMQQCDCLENLFSDSFVVTDRHGKANVYLCNLCRKCDSCCINFHVTFVQSSMQVQNVSDRNVIFEEKTGQKDNHSSDFQIG